VVIVVEFISYTGMPLSCSTFNNAVESNLVTFDKWLFIDDNELILVVGGFEVNRYTH